jgi:hypothetical protein
MSSNYSNHHIPSDEGFERYEFLSFELEYRGITGKALNF